MSIRVLVVDDHAVVRQGLRIFLDMDADITIVGEAADGAAAVELTRKLRPDVVLMDLLLPVMDGVTATNSIRQELPDTEVIALTSVLESASVFRGSSRSHRLSAQGYRRAALAAGNQSSRGWAGAVVAGGCCRPGA